MPSSRPLLPIDWRPTPLGRTAQPSGAGPRVCVVGKRNVLHWDEHVADAFVDAGCEVRHYAVNRRPGAIAVARAGLRAIAGNRGTAIGDGWHARRMHDDMQRFRPHLVVFVSVFFLPVCFLRAARSLEPAPHVVGWDGDAAVRFERAEQYAGLVDVLGITERSLLEQGASLFPRACYLPYAANPRVYQDVGAERAPRAYFCGAMTDDRAALLSTLTGAPLTVRGPGWERFTAPSAAMHVRPGKVGLHDQARDYSEHLVVWNQHQAVNNPHGSLNMRDFEAPASGALLVSDHREHMGEHFEVGDEVLTYAEDAELDALLRAATRDPAASAARASRARARVLAHDTYRHRAEELLAGS